jgi:hypothetical protein
MRRRLGASVVILFKVVGLALTVFLIGTDLLVNR